jgi:type IV secretory pathway ATPase VirB11/archaellum biosynthesis ATPase
MVTAISLATITALPAYAFSGGMLDGANAARGAGQATDLFGATGIFNTITNVLLFVIGAISVIMIIIGGLRYVISGGNSSNVTAAKNTILYAIVGLLVALFAYAMINFVLTNFASGGLGGSEGLDV